MSQFFGQQIQRKSKGCRNQSKRGKPSHSKLNSGATAHEQLAIRSFFSPDLCRGKQRLNSQACEVDYMYSLF